MSEMPSALLASSSGMNALWTDLITFGMVVIFGVLGYVLAQQTLRLRGSTPWRIPAFVWAIFSALLPIWGLAIEWLARLTTRPAAVAPHPPAATLDRWATPGGPVEPPAPGSAPSSWPDPASLRPGPGGWVPSLPTLAGPADKPPLFGWYPDPDGRHELRFWDGRMWSEHVRDGETASDDPLPAWSAPWQAGLDARPAQAPTA